MRILSFCLSFCAIIMCASCQSTESKSAQKPYIKNLDVPQFEEKRKEKDIVVLDVRTAAEVAEGNIPGHIHVDINSDQFEQQMNQLDKTKEYLVYCKSGGRSTRACQQMLEYGFTRINNLAGGYTAWSKAKSSNE